MAKLKENYEEQARIELGKREKERNLLLEEKNKWDNGRKELEEEKKRLKYKLFDLMKASDAN